MCMSLVLSTAFVVALAWPNTTPHFLHSSAAHRAAAIRSLGPGTRASGKHPGDPPSPSIPAVWKATVSLKQTSDGKDAGNAIINTTHMVLAYERDKKVDYNAAAGVNQSCFFYRNN